MKKVAALDLGSNTFLCLIAEGEFGKISTTLFDEVHNVRLGQDVQKTKMFHPEALSRAKNSLIKFSEEIKKYGATEIQAVATAAARNVTNGDELFKICEELNIPLKIISGVEEAQTTYLGAIAGKKANNEITLVIDIGGGSTELIVGRGKNILFADSLKMGGVFLKDYFEFPEILTDENTDLIKKYIRIQANEVLQKIFQYKIERIIAVAGTPTELAKIIIGEFEKNKIEDFELSNSTIEDFFQKMRAVSVEERVQKMGVSSGRADIIIFGALILIEVLAALKTSSVFVGTQGVRYGVAEKLLL